MKISIKDIVDKRDGSIMSYVVFHCLGEYAKAKEVYNVEDKELDIVLTINGHEMDFEDCCNYWQDQVNRMITQRANELLSEKFAEVNDLLYDFEERLKDEVSKRLEEWEKDN